MTKARRLRAGRSRVKQSAWCVAGLLWLAACGNDGGDRWNREGMKVAARASTLRHTFDDATKPDSLRLAAARDLLALDAEYLATRYARVPRFVRPILDEAVAAGDSAGLVLAARLFESHGGEQRIEFEADLLAYGPRARAYLRPFLARSDRGLVVRAADALAKSGAPEAAADLAPLLQHEEEWIRMGAAHALGRLDDTAATEALLEALQDSAYAVVNAALVGLSRQGAAAAYEPALALLEDARAEVRKHAAHALGQIGDPRARERLRHVSRDDPDSGVRFMATRALDELRGDGP